MMQLGFAETWWRGTGARWLMALLVLSAAGCGGSDDSEAVSDPLAPPAAELGSADAGGEGGDSEVTGSPSGHGTASITVGDESFEFEWQVDGFNRCNPDFLGVFAANHDRDDRVGFELELPMDDRLESAPKVEVGGGEVEYWTADPNEASSYRHESWPAAVDSFEVNGNTASGTATFVGSTPFDEEPVGVAGTFEITCAG